MKRRRRNQNERSGSLTSWNVNKKLFRDSVFSPHIPEGSSSGNEYASKRQFKNNYSRLFDISKEIHSKYSGCSFSFKKRLGLAEFNYYAVALLWNRLLHVKATQFHQVLTDTEDIVRERLGQYNFSVPEPLYIYLMSIGTYTDKYRGNLQLTVPSLPVVEAGGRTGYHAAEVNLETHNDFEEIPSLGVVGDVLMALASDSDSAQPEHKVKFPPGARPKEHNFLGRISLSGHCRQENRANLWGFGIEENKFKEDVPGTRINLSYLHHISNILSFYKTFKLENLRPMTGDENIMTGIGASVQVVSTVPEDNSRRLWTEREVISYSTIRESSAVMNGAVFTAFQLFKEDATGETATERALNWSCVEPEPGSNWTMPQEWIDNRNANRNLPPEFSTKRFRNFQDYSSHYYQVIDRLTSKPLHYSSDSSD